MSLVPRINFPINFYLWEGRCPSFKETKGRGKKGEGGGVGGRKTGVWPRITLHLHRPSVPPRLLKPASGCLYP